MIQSVNCLHSIGGRFVKILFGFLLITNQFIVHAQYTESTFKKIFIEIDGEEVFDVSIITQDHRGYIWMATNFGLIRYNGLEGKKYPYLTGDSSSIAFDYIESLYVDHIGEMWIGSRSGIRKYNPDCDCIQRFPAVYDRSDINGILSITEDKDKNIWIGTENGGLFQYDRESESFTRFLNNSSDSITVVNDRIAHLLVDQNNNLWIGTDTYEPIDRSGLLRYQIQSGKLKRFSHDPKDPNSLTDNRISALYEDQQGHILIGTSKCGFHIYDPKTESIQRMQYDAENPGQLHAPYSKEYVFSGPPYVRLIHQDRNGNYWISTTGKGINYFDTKTKTLKNYTFNLVNPQLLWSFLEDRQGNIWIGGSMGSGLFRMDLYARKYHLNTSFTNVEAAYESSHNPGILWIKSQEAGLCKMNLETNEITRYLYSKEDIESIGHNWTRSTYQENKNTLWIGIGNGGAYGEQAGNGGIDRLDIEKETFTHFKLTRDDDGMDDFSYTPYSIFEDNEGILWLGTGPGGIFRSNREKTEFTHFEFYKTDNSSKDYFLNIVRMDANGDIWASDFKDDGVIYLYDRKEDKFYPFIKGFKAYNIILDDKGWIVISTWEKGLVHLNPVDNSYIQYTKNDGLPSNDALDIFKGDGGIFWVGTRIGAAKFDPGTGEISSIGLPKVRYNTGVILATDGQVYIGTNNGLVSFYPEQVKGNPFPPQINISEMLISEENYLTGNKYSNELILSYKQNDIAFKYTGIHYSNPGKNNYRYKLDPIDDQWINAGNERTVRFANLSPGKYNFQVKASNSYGVWSDKIESIKFTIKPPWWIRWWAFILYLAIAIAFADRFYRFQLSKRMATSESNRLKEMNQFKNTLFTNITHEFRTPLTVIKGMTDSIKSSMKNKHVDDLDISLEMIERNSDGLLQLVNELLDLAKIESGNMELQLVQADVIPFLKYIGESFHSYAEENQINLTIYSETDTLIMDYDANKLTSIISNLLSNAIKFTPGPGKIIVHIKQTTHKENNFLFIKIIDSGVGIAEEELPNIFNRFYQTDASTIRKSGGTGIGLALTKELVDLMEGTIEAKSTPEHGSEFSIRIPVTRRAPLMEHAETVKVTHIPVAKTVSTPPVQIVESDSELPLVLIIEDNMDVVHYLKTCLKDNYQTIHAENGLTGIEMAIEKIPDIIISDVMMPGKDGFEVCATLKTDERTDHIPIIILTAKVTFEDRLKGLSHGADAYLAKPFNKEELFTRLDQLVSIRKKLIAKIQKQGFSTLFKKRTKNPKLQFLQKVEKLVHEDIDNSDFGSADLAKKLLISDSQLYRKIKAITGRSTAVFIRSIRLQYAKELLIISDKTVSEVAYEVGFNDPSWFSRAFKDEFGFAPSTRSK